MLLFMRPLTVCSRSRFTMPDFVNCLYQISSIKQTLANTLWSLNLKPLGLIPSLNTVTPLMFRPLPFQLLPSVMLSQRLSLCVVTLLLR